MQVEQVIRFETDDPDQAAALAIIRNIKKGSKGKLISNAIIRTLSGHNLGNITFNPAVAAQFLELLLQMPPGAAVPTFTVAEGNGISFEKDKKKKKKVKKPVKDNTITPVTVIDTPSAPVLEERKAEAPGTDNEYPWRLPNGKMRTLTDEEAMALQDKPEIIELYAKEIMDYAAEHPEDAPPL